MYRAPLVSGEIYHIYNRGNDKRVIFSDDHEYSRFDSLVRHYLIYDYPYSHVQSRLQQSTRDRAVISREEILAQLEASRFQEPLVEVICYTQMPNHFHLVLRQVANGGISNFMHRLGTGYTNYFNLRHERSGTLFEGRFKYVRVESEIQLIYLSGYIHINALAAGLVGLDTLVTYPWSSLAEYLGKSKEGICKKEVVMSNFGDEAKYLEFILASARGSRESGVRQVGEVAIDDDFGWFGELRLGG
ncbi:transposase [Candidatus Parcubacteria bacterium]|nr:transposase [Candidatus Parcubacteria bacterium]